MRKTRKLFQRHTSEVGTKALAANEAELLIYDEIGMWGIRASDVVRELQGLKIDTLHLRINSPGGDVTEGVAIYQAIRRTGAKVITHVDGLAASIASLIALAGDQVEMASNAFLMIHEAWGITVGTGAEHRATASILDKMDAMIVGIYAGRIDATEEEIRAFMQAETWFTAQEAVDIGLADTVLDNAPAAKARFDLSLFKHAPAALADGSAGVSTIRDVERTLRDAGMSRTEAKAFIAAGHKALESQRDAGDAGLISRLEQLEATIQSFTGAVSHG